jgi:hypothetical protein
LPPSQNSNARGEDKVAITGIVAAVYDRRKLKA